MNTKKYQNEKVEIDVIESWCKGCAICVDYCPHDVLVMERGLVKVVDIDACTACGLCELHCPDFAIVIHDKKKEAVKEE